MRKSSRRAAALPVAGDSREFTRMNHPVAPRARLNFRRGLSRLREKPCRERVLKKVRGGEAKRWERNKFAWLIDYGILMIEIVGNT